jgi:NDP-sugar pyrophosphorylase family protein
MTNLLVLAGGYGSRLRRAVPLLPKALAPVGGSPFLQLQLEKWFAEGLRKFTFLLYYQADRIIDFIRLQETGSLKECKFDWLIEPRPMGTGGAVAQAVRKLNLRDDFLVTNADTWLGGGIQDLIHANSPTIAVVKVSDTGRYGEVLFDSVKAVTAFTEKNDIPSAGWVNAGFYRLSASLFMDWDGEPFSLERKLFAELVEVRGLSAVPLQSDFIDIGVPEDYYRFCQWVEAGRQMPL